VYCIDALRSVVTLISGGEGEEAASGSCSIRPVRPGRRKQRAPHGSAEDRFRWDRSIRVILLASWHAEF
jgi:hypothetical protein